MKNIVRIMVRCTAFAVIFSILFFSATGYLRRADDEVNEIHAFYSEPKDSIDVMFMGSSPILRGVSPMVLWNQE